MGWRTYVFSLALVGCGWTTPALGSTTNYTSRNDFLVAVAPATSITFTSIPANTTLTNQFAGAGVTFTDGDDQVVSGGSFADGLGVSGDAVSQNIDSITLQFSPSILAVGCDFPGALAIRLFDGATEVGYSGQFGSVGTGFFGGVTSTVPFTRAVITDPFAVDVFVDNLYFSTVPEPQCALAAVIPLLATAAARPRAPRC